MPKVIYIEKSGVTHCVEVPIGSSVMEGGRNAGVEGMLAECGGACSCATCHVYVNSDWLERVPPMEAMELDMLDFAPSVDLNRSRLSCQIRITAELDGLIINIADCIQGC